LILQFSRTAEQRDDCTIIALAVTIGAASTVGGCFHSLIIII
jgi:hypothetical protein